MLKDFRIAALFYIGILFTGLACGDTGLSDLAQEKDSLFYSQLNRFIAGVQRNNPLLASAEFQVRRTKASAASASSLEAPKFGVEFFQTPLSSFPNPLRNQAEIDYSLEQMIPFPGKRAKFAAPLYVKAEALSKRKTALARDLIFSLKSVYFDLYLIDRKLEVNSESRLLLTQFAGIAGTQYGVGQGKQVDVLRARTELIKLENDSILLGAMREGRVATLNALLNQEVALKVETIPATLPPVCPHSPDDWVKKALGARPELLAMQDEVRMQDAMVSAARSEYYPDFMLKGMYKDMDKMDDAWSLMVNLSLPFSFWSAGRVKQGLDESKAASQSMQAELANMKNTIRAEVVEAQAVFRASETAAARLRQQLLPQAASSFESARAAYQSGSGDFLMLLDGLRTLLDAKLDYYQAVAECLRGYARLEQVVGVDQDLQAVTNSIGEKK